MKHFYLSLLLVCSFTATYAQRNYIPGGVITLQQDSLKGLIDYRNWAVAPSSISFKSGADGKEQVFKPGDILGFWVGSPNENYVSRKLKLDITPQSIDYLSRNETRIYQEDSVFLTRISNGIYPLYEYTDKNGRVHYIFEGADHPAEELLMIRKNYGGENGTIGVQDLPYYKQQLFMLFQDCVKIAERTDRLSYRKSDLVKIFVSYNNCKNPQEAIAVQKKEKVHIRFGLLAGISANSYSFKGAQRFAEGKYDNTVGPLFGIAASFPFARSRQQFSLNGELFYKTVKTGSLIDGIENYSVHQVDFKLSYLQFNVLARYTYPSKVIKPYATVGIGNAFAISVKDEMTTNYTDGRVKVEPAMGGPRKYEQSLIGGVGIHCKGLEIEGRYNSSNGFSSLTYLKTTISSWQLLVRYMLF